MLPVDIKEKKLEMMYYIWAGIEYILISVGLWKLFGKSNIKKWWALVPGCKHFQLAKCADREEEAGVFFATSLLTSILQVIYSVLNSAGRNITFAGYLIVILMLVMGIMNLIYGVRIYSGLCEVYEKKKIWIPGWIFVPWAVAIIWGLSKGFQPKYIPVSDDQNSENTGQNVAALKDGLTININKRTARKGFSTKTLLQDVHFTIEPGKMVLLLGGSGAGKTTFINAVTGYEKADAEILLNGVDVYKRFDKMKYEIGQVPQQDLIRGNDTVYRTLMDAAMLRLPSSVSRKERHERVEEVMKLFGLSSIKNNIVAKQSGGQKKRISIATEYISDPTLFILDEPDSGLDGILARELMERLHDISREGKIVIVITHTPDRVIDLFDQVIVLAKDENRTGRLVYFGDIDDAKAFFERDKMEDIVRTINRPDEGGEGRTDELLAKFEESRNVANK